MTDAFERYELRSTDPAAAEAFYIAVFGPEFWTRRRGPASEMICGKLPEQAAARGAPSHWLGHIGVADSDASVARFVAAGAERLGPPRTIDGVPVVALRDPVGSAIALSKAIAGEGSQRVAWHFLNTRDADRAWALYADGFGWSACGETERAGVVFRKLGWGPGAPERGSIAQTVREGQEHPHPHWLYYFEVAYLEDAIAKVTTAGGEAFGPIVELDQKRFAPCHDPQGAAFGLVELVLRPS